ncbi:unnamed protein product [Prorocentrum cordatum]|uniref:Uncharacterized protein n=1 Tax=Prorocentrum cordatum TaxID=2364126 RepID=A0ABN9QCW7_9DINO|nr:unnamed protein product [Polarella glacialis]
MSGFTMQLVIRRLTMAFALCGGVCADLQLMNRSSHDYVVQPRAGCRTAVAGDHCYDKVSWAMLTGVQKYPDWFSPLTSSSSFEDFQRHLHAMPKFSNACPEPCAARAVETPAVQAQLPASASCHAPVEGDECHKRVVWAMEKGAVKYPAQFAPLTSRSSFEDFQRHLHAMPKFSNVCPEPCAARAVEIVVPAPLPQVCHTSVDGEACYRKVMWAMESGVAKYPDWFFPLTNTSKFEDVQRHLHGIPKFSIVCPEPCAARAVEVREPIQVPARDSAKPTERAVRTRMEGSNQTGDPWIVNGYDQTGSNCECGNIIQSLPTGYETPLLCASACNMYPRCMSIGVHEDTIWPGHCDLFDAPCNDTDGHDEAGTTCAKPVHEQGISLNFNRVQTDSPTPSPTPAPDACEIANGTGPSASYPCACGPVVCGTSEICSNATCSPPSYLHVDWPCSWPSIGDPNFIISGTSAGGAPIYVNFHGSYIYFDESCDGEVRGGDSRVPRWIIDDSAPSVSAVMDLDSDRSCSYYGHYESDDSHGLPLGSSTWVTFCEGVLQAVTAEITYLHEEPNVTATPAPTLPPGTACPCDQKCAGFPYVDTDGDGCLSEPECKYLPPVIGNFGELDLDGDGCVTLNECVESPLGEFLPMFPISAPNHCDFGHYFTPGTSLCVVCTNGETRRRRSEACTKCPPGRDDFGDFDTCIGGAYLKEPLYPGNCTACVNSDTDENGQTLTRGDSVVISTRNPDPGHYEIVTIIGKITVDNQTCFHVEPCVNDSYDPYDSLISDCTEHDGRSTSSTYPCGCGVDECAEGEVCDLDGNAGRGICIPPSWTVPTPAPTVSARGDPHLVNLHGEHFDVNHGGDFTLLRIPQAQSEPPMVKLKASVRPEHGRPCTTYITEVEVSGSLLGGRTLQVRSYLRAHAENETDKFLGVRVHGVAGSDGQAALRDYLFGAWLHKSAEEAARTLRFEEYFVTNQKDKEVNLQVLAGLDERVKGILEQNPSLAAAFSSKGGRDTPPAPAPSLAAAFSSKEAAPGLLEALRGDAESGVRREAAAALGKLGAAEAAPGLLEALRGDAESGAAPGLLEALRGDADSVVRWEAAAALVKLDAAEAAPGLLRMLEEDVDPEFRRTAAKVLDRFDPKDLALQLVRTVRNRDMSIPWREIAASELARLVTKDAAVALALADEHADALHDAAQEEEVGKVFRDSCAKAVGKIDAAHAQAADDAARHGTATQHRASTSGS